MAGYVGILSVELHFPENGSLKGKRKYVKSAKAQLHERFGATVAEVEFHEPEVWRDDDAAALLIDRPGDPEAECRDLRCE